MGLPEELADCGRVGIIPRGTVWSAINRLTKTISDSPQTPLRVSEPRDGPGSSVSSTGSSANLETL